MSADLSIEDSISALKTPTPHLNEYLEKPIPPTLWHYTSVAGLEGILSSRRIFATNIRSLNDWEEAETGRRIAMEESELVEEEVSGFRIRDQIKSAISHLFGIELTKEEGTQAYVASFTQDEDSLSQWRGYSHGSAGASVGFDLRGIRPKSGKGVIQAFAPCIYDEDKSRALISAIMERYKDNIQEIARRAGDKEPIKLLMAKGLSCEQAVDERSKDLKSWLREAPRSLAGELAIAIPLIKNEHFRSEVEWRAVLPYLPSKKPFPIEYRLSGSAPIPYTAVAIEKDAENAMNLTHVRLGPGKYEEVVFEKWKMLLQSKHYADVKVDRSAIPYRTGSS